MLKRDIDLNIKKDLIEFITELLSTEFVEDDDKEDEYDDFDPADECDIDEHDMEIIALKIKLEYLEECRSKLISENNNLKDKVIALQDALLTS